MSKNRKSIERVIISKEGLKIKYWSYDEEKEEGQTFFDLYDSEKDSIFYLLRQSCEIEEGVTLRDFCNIVKKDETLKMFIAQYSHCVNIDEWLNQIDEEPPVEDDDPEEEKIEKLFIDRCEEISDFEGKIEIDMSAGFHGKGKNETYSLSGTHLGKYKDVPIELNEELLVYSWNKDEYKEISKGNFYFSLLDVLDTFFWDISFYGSPSDSKIFFEEIKQSIKDIDSGKVELIPWEDVKKNLEEKINKKNDENT
jgi:hypothetical protein